MVKWLPSMQQSLGLDPQYHRKTNVVAHSYNSNIQEVETVGLEVQDHLQLHIKFEQWHCLKKNKVYTDLKDIYC